MKCDNQELGYFFFQDLIQTSQFLHLCQQFALKTAIFVLQTEKKSNGYGIATSMIRNYFGMYILTIPRKSRYHDSFYALILPLLK
jgi:hypothetical protein